MSAAFIEPLESNGLFSVHEFMLEFCSQVDRPKVTQWDRDVYNASIRKIYNNFAEFVALHYALSIRDDTAYWRANRDRVYDNNLMNTKSGFNDLYLRKTDSNSHYGQGGIISIANGMNYNVYSEIDAMREALGKQINLQQKFNDYQYERRGKMHQWNEAVKNQLSVYDWLKQNIYSDGDSTNE